MTDHLRVSGVSRVVVDLATNLSDRGYSVTVAASSEGGLWSELPREIEREYLPERKGFGGLSRARRIACLVQSRRFDIVHVHQRGVASLARFLKVGSRTKLVEHVHNVFLPVTARALSFRGDRLIACGSAVASMLRDNYRRPTSLIDTVHNGVKDRAQGCDLSLPDQGPLRLLGIGRLEDQKDPLRFVRVVDEVRRLKVDVKATWVGAGSLLDQCRSLVTELGLSDHVDFTGETSDVGREILRADALLLTSRWEGLPLAVLEAFSLGRGAILPDVGSCRDALQDGVNGLLYSNALSPEEIARRIAHEATRTSLVSWGSASRAVYEERFRLPVMIDRVEEVYSRVIKRGTLSTGPA